MTTKKPARKTAPAEKPAPESPTATGHVVEAVFRCPCGASSTVGYRGLSDSGFTMDEATQNGLNGWLSAHAHLQP